MKIPESITVLGKEITIQLAESEFFKEEDDEQLDGKWDPIEDIIYIDINLSKHDQMSTLLHELFHSVLSRVAVTISGGLSPEMGEIIVENLATFVAETFTLKLKNK